MAWAMDNRDSQTLLAFDNLEFGEISFQRDFCCSRQCRANCWVNLLLLKGITPVFRGIKAWWSSVKHVSTILLCLLSAMTLCWGVCGEVCRCWIPRDPKNNFNFSYSPPVHHRLNKLKEWMFESKAPFGSRKTTYRKMFFEKWLTEKYFTGKKKKISVKYFTDLKSVRYFTEKWLDFPLTRKIFSVDHLFSVKQTPENPKNIFL